MDLYPNKTDLKELQTAVTAIKAELGKWIVGQHQMVELLVVALLSNGHVLLEGVPGVAKTLTAKLLTRSLALSFSRIQFTPDLMPSDVLGTSIFNPKDLTFNFRQGPIFAHLVLVDEINRAPAKTQAALFEVMEERQVTMDGTTYGVEPPFLVLATQNPIEHEGTYRLPEAQLDRFLFKIKVDYPSLEEEVEILTRHHARKGPVILQNLPAILTGPQVQAYQGQVQTLEIREDLIQYIAKIVHSTRQHPSLFLGASPRASLAILTASKAMAAIRGRDFVTPEDIKEVALPVLRHRVQLTPEREMEGATPDDVVQELVERIEVPR